MSKIIVRSPGPPGPTGTGAPIDSPVFTGNPRVPTQPADDNSTKAASTAFVQQELANDVTKAAAVHTHTAAQITDLMAFLAGKIVAGANVTIAYNSGAGTITISSTGGGGGGGGGVAFTNSAELRALLSDPTGTQQAVFANSPVFTGTPSAPTAPADTNTTQLATCAYVLQEIGNDTTKAAASHTHTAAQVSDLLSFLQNRFIAGANTTITYNAGAGTWTIASTGGGGGGGGDALTTNPLSQFAATTSAQLAGVISDETGSAGGGVLTFSNSPAFTGTPTAPTAAGGTNTTQLATTAFVTAAVAAASGAGAYSITYASVITPVLASGVLANVGTLTGNMLVNPPTGTPVDGQRLTLRLNQNATGGWTVSFDAIYRFGLDLTAADLSTSPNAENRLTFQFNSAAAKWEAVGLVRF